MSLMILIRRGRSQVEGVDRGENKEWIITHAVLSEQTLRGEWSGRKDEQFAEG